MVPTPNRYTHRAMGILLTYIPYTLMYNVGD